MIDFHTHILPNIDDGSNDVSTSIEILNRLKSQGVKLVCLTSHFYPRNESIDVFLNRRNKAFELIKDYKDIDFKLGSEVHYYRGISQSEDIDKLCLEGTNIILIELSFNHPFNENVELELFSLINKGYKVVLAHIERYNLDESKLIYLHNKGVLLQVNTEYINGFFTSSKALKWLKNGIIDLIGTDTHNMSDRAPDYDKAMAKIAKKLGPEFLRKFVEKTYKIIG